METPETYLSLLPADTIYEIVKYFDDKDNIEYITLKTLSKFVNPDVFEYIFRIEYPRVYTDIKSVIHDDKYLQTVSPYEWVELYSHFRKIYPEIERFLKMHYPHELPIDKDLMYPYKYIKSFTIDNLFGLNIEHHPILYRALFKKKFLDVYNKINQLETHERRELGIYYKFPWKSLVKLYLNVYDESFASLNPIEIHDVEHIFNDIFYQSNYDKLLEVLSEQKEVANLISNSMDIDYLLELMILPNNPDYIRDITHFKHLYLHFNPTEDYKWEYLHQTIQNDDFNLFKWLLDQGETSWIDNTEFSEALETFLTEVKSDNPRKEYAMGKYGKYLEELTRLSTDYDYTHHLDNVYNENGDV